MKALKILNPGFENFIFNLHQDGYFMTTTHCKFNCTYESTVSTQTADQKIAVIVDKGVTAKINIFTDLDSIFIGEKSQVIITGSKVAAQTITLQPGAKLSFYSWVRFKNFSITNPTDQALVFEDMHFNSQDLLDAAHELHLYEIHDGTITAQMDTVNLKALYPHMKILSAVNNDFIKMLTGQNVDLHFPSNIKDTLNSHLFHIAGITANIFSRTNGGDFNKLPTTMIRKIASYLDVTDVVTNQETMIVGESQDVDLPEKFADDSHE